LFIFEYRENNESRPTSFKLSEDQIKRLKESKYILDEENQHTVTLERIFFLTFQELQEYLQRLFFEIFHDHNIVFEISQFLYRRRTIFDLKEHRPCRPFVALYSIIFNIIYSYNI
jgi:hypothetical protein